MPDGLPVILRDLRKAGWRVAVHNDYMIDGQLMTFWLFTRGTDHGVFIKGEGPDDLTAVLQCDAAARKLYSPQP